MSRPLYAYAYAHVPFDAAIRVLVDDPDQVLRVATDEAVTRADEVVSRLHVDVGGFEVGRDVDVVVGTVRLAERHRVIVPLTWRAASGAPVFPTVDAQLEIALLSHRPPLLQVTLVGAYDPPLGVLGEFIDRAMAHRIAEAAIHTLVNDVAARLTAEASSLVSSEAT